MADDNAQGQGQQGTEQQQVDWRQRHDQLAAQYQQDMEKVYNALQQSVAAQNQQQAPQQAPPPQPEAEWDVNDPKALRANVESSLRSTVHQSLAPVVNAFAGSQFESHMMSAGRDEAMPYFRHWEQEIRGLARQVNPVMLADYTTIRNIYALVAARHANELVEIEVQKRMAASRTPADEDVEVELEEPPSMQSPTVPSSPAPRASTSPPAAVQQQRMQDMQLPRSTRQGATRRMSREEAYMAERMGMSRKSYLEAKDMDEDIKI